MIQSGVIEIRLSDHKFVYCTRNTSLLKLNEHYKTSFGLMKNYSNKIFVNILRPISSINQSSYSRVNDAYKNFAIKFSSADGSFSTTETLRLKSNTKPWFHIDVLNAIPSHDANIFYGFFSKLPELIGTKASTSKNRFGIRNQRKILVTDSTCIS